MTVIMMEMGMVTEVEMVTKTKMKNIMKVTGMVMEAAMVTKMRMIKMKMSITKAMDMTTEAKMVKKTRTKNTTKVMVMITMTTTTIPEMKPMRILLAQLIKAVV